MKTIYIVSWERKHDILNDEEMEKILNGGVIIKDGIRYVSLWGYIDINIEIEK